MDYLKASMDDILDICEANNSIEWHISLLEEKNEEGKAKYSYIEIKRMVFLKYHSELVPKAKNTKAPSMLDKAKARLNK